MKLILYKSKVILLISLITSPSYSQEARPDSEFKSTSVYINYTNSIFNTPIEQYKYVRSSRGIEIYETYRHPTNGRVNQTIFPKTMPIAVIKTNPVNRNIIIYRNYSNSIYNRPIEFATIKSKKDYQQTKPKNTLSKDLPKYSGEGDIEYGE